MKSKITSGIVIGAFIYNVRKSKNISIRQAARDLNIDISRLSKFENGKTNIVFNDLLKICKYYGVDLEVSSND
jgi:transcriptional regulator with XRE-family HTH domain